MPRWLTKAEEAAEEDVIRREMLPGPPPFDPVLDAVRWIEDPWHGPSRPRRWSCWLVFWRRCPHRDRLGWRQRLASQVPMIMPMMTSAAPARRVRRVLELMRPV